MKLTPSKSLTDAELDLLSDMLLACDNDSAILDVSQLDGFLTAIVSGPDMIHPSQWLPELWGGPAHEPEWKNEAQMQRFMSLVMQHMNSIATALMAQPKSYVPLFNASGLSDDLVLIAEEWCFGYMRGVDLGGWPALPADVDTWLYAIALHGREENFKVLDTMSQEEHQQTVRQIGSAVLKLHQYFLAQRTPPPSPRQATVRTGPKVGRNDPCPCGSGRKFKQCCLH